MSVLVTGGAGYIGSHTVLTLLQKGIDVIVIDDFSNSSLESLERVKKITNRDIKVYKGDVADLRLLNLIFSNHDIHTWLFILLVLNLLGSLYQNQFITIITML
ncbi:hypothetical protein ECZU39_00010 [Escherichia coli]|nr:hypothetical protein ECZU39_00010 [Escherichia coli]